MSDLTPAGDPDPAASLSNVRAGDADRRLALDILSLAMTKGHLSPVEYEERADKAIAAKTFGELDALTDDLPTNQLRPPTAQSTRPAYATDIEPTTHRIAVMSGSELKGSRAAVGETLNAFALMGGVEIDLREVTFTSPTLTIRANAIMGGIEIVVPQDATVRINGIGIMGGFGGEADAEGSGNPGAPTITVAGLALMGGVSVVRRPLEHHSAPSLKKR